MGPSIPYTRFVTILVTNFRTFLVLIHRVSPSSSYPTVQEAPTPKSQSRPIHFALPRPTRRTTAVDRRRSSPLAEIRRVSTETPPSTVEVTKGEEEPCPV